MKVLSLFDGMACGRIAFDKLGIKVDQYYAYEIDKYAIQVATHNFPDIKEHGDVFEADFTQYIDVDYLIGGSPCTYWSIAQKNNRETTASGLGWELFSQYVRALKEAQPKYFLYENNKSMSDDIRKSISDAFGFEPICINSALVSAQNRKRLYWCGKRNLDGTYSKVDIEHPIDRGIVLRDILDNGERIPPYGNNDKSRPIEALYNNHAGTGEGSLEKRLCSDNKNKQQVDLIAEPIRVGSLPRPNGELSESQAMRIYSVDGKSVAQSAQGGGMGGKTGLYAVPINDCNGKTYPVYEVLNGLITIKDKQYPIKLVDGYYIIRKLTVNECKRLQTVPENYDMSVISNSQAYKCLGNGWTVDVICHLIKSSLEIINA